MIALSEISALLQVVMVDLVLAVDNALVVGMVAASGWLHETFVGKWLGIDSFKIDMAMIAAVLTVIFLVVWFRWRKRIGPIGFYVLFALMVTTSVQLVGVYLVFASLIIPGLATRELGRWRLVSAFIVGLLGYAIGLLLSLFYARFWCRNLCPAGAFLSLLNGVRLLRRFVPPVGAGCWRTVINRCVPARSTEEK